MADPTMWKMARIDTSKTDDEFAHDDKTVKMVESESGRSA